jgi:hypothetical protein
LFLSKAAQSLKKYLIELVFQAKIHFIYKTKNQFTMQKIAKTVIYTLVCAFALVGCGEKQENADAAKQDSSQVAEQGTASQEESLQVSEEALRSFLHSKEGTYDWMTTADDLALDFFQDGRMHVQGPDGEATMWTGIWSLQGNQLTMECENCGKMPPKQRLPIRIEGESLRIGDKVYTRYMPE